MSLDLNATDPSVAKAMEALSAEQRVALCARIAERLLPLYKGFVDGHDWLAVEPYLEEGWKFVAKKKVALKRVLWDRTGQLITHYYHDGKPLLLYGVASSTDLLRAMKHAADGYAPTAAAGACRKLLDAAAEVDAVLVAHGKKARAVDAETSWLAAKKQLAAKDTLVREPIAMDDPKTLPEWFADLKSCAAPVRTVKLA